MADQKISAMPAATAIANADVVPVVQGGVNKKSTRQLFLTANVAEDVFLTGSAGQVAGVRNAATTSGFSVNGAGAAQLSFVNSFNLTLASLGTLLNITSAGLVTFSDGGSNQAMTFGVVGSSCVVFTGPGGTVTFTATNGVFIPFIDNGAGNWASAPPNNWQTAIYRLAAQVQALSLGVPIP